ncbi:Hint domain-containing protein [Primorskyibacter sp. S187A]|uniref:Hint domain-containing protein n=1 Tax=Primorskyibacter sp. S187A TaxID=3415130 RepID=UPI003C79D4C7
MNTGFRGTYVISWSQTETDGFKGAPPHSLNVGSTWSWTGDTLRVDGPADVVRLEGSPSVDALRQHAARKVRRLIGAAFDDHKTPGLGAHAASFDDPLLEDSSFVVTDGARSFTVTLVPAGPGRRPLAMFHNDIPPQNKDFWVVHHTLDVLAHSSADDLGLGGVICFTPGTRIATPKGSALVEDLREGDLVQTKDNGAQEILWRGSRRMTGARLFALPHLRPVRIQASAFGIDQPDETFLVSPDHKLIMRGAAAQELFNTSEVLVSAKHLINAQSIVTDLRVKEVMYIHLLLPQHEIMFANGVESESFHPAQTSLSTLSDEDRARLLAGMPALSSDPHVYGASARRTLSASEAALLRHAA